MFGKLPVHTRGTPGICGVLKAAVGLLYVRRAHKIEIGTTIALLAQTHLVSWGALLLLRALRLHLHCCFGHHPVNFMFLCEHFAFHPTTAPPIPTRKASAHPPQQQQSSSTAALSRSSLRALLGLLPRTRPRRPSPRIRRL
jgi:hypothetical protein